jgi:hypothetical protein
MSVSLDGSNGVLTKEKKALVTWDQFDRFRLGFFT